MTYPSPSPSLSSPTPPSSPPPPLISPLDSPFPFIHHCSLFEPYEYPRFPVIFDHSHPTGPRDRYRIFSPSRPQSESVYDNLDYDLPHDLPYSHIPATYRTLLVPLASSEECSLSLFSSSIHFFSPLSSPSITREFIYLSRAPLASPDPSSTVSFDSSPMSTVGHWVHHPPSATFDGYLEDMMTYPSSTVSHHHPLPHHHLFFRRAPLAHSESSTPSRLSSLSWGTASDSLFNSTEASLDLPAFSDSGIAFQSFYSQLQQLQQESTVLQLQPTRQRMHSIVLLEPQKELPLVRMAEIKDHIFDRREGYSERGSLDIPFIDDSDVSRDL